ncbi:MAG TPA: hypothetical protein VIV15_10285, partial [Anaerolineales bacterium]
SLHAKRSIKGIQAGPLTNEGCDPREQPMPTEQTLQNRHLDACKGVGFGVISAETDAVEKDEEDSHD